MLAIGATSSRRGPAVRGRRPADKPAGKPTSAGASRSRRDLSNWPSAAGSPPVVMVLRVLMPVPVKAALVTTVRGAEDGGHDNHQDPRRRRHQPAGVPGPARYGPGTGRWKRGASAVR